MKGLSNGCCCCRCCCCCCCCCCSNCSNLHLLMFLCDFVRWLAGIPFPSSDGAVASASCHQERTLSAETLWLIARWTDTTPETTCARRTTDSEIQAPQSSSWTYNVSLIFYIKKYYLLFLEHSKFWLATQRALFGYVTQLHDKLITFSKWVRS